MYFKLAFRFHVYPEIPEMLETHTHKKQYHKTKMSQIIVFWSIRKIKMPRNIVFRPNREIKMPGNSKMFQNVTKISCHENFLP